MEHPRLLVILLVVLLCPFSVYAQVGETFMASVTRVADGDTVTVFHDGGSIRIRLEGIDTPELDQSFGTQAHAFTSSRVLGEEVTIAVRDVDRYGRLVSRMYLGEIDLSLALVSAGLAWHYTRYSDDQLLARAEVEARKKRTGIWSQEMPVSPWEYRRR